MPSVPTTCAACSCPRCGSESAATSRRSRASLPALWPAGLWSIPVPIANNPLRYVLVYAFETDKGPYLVDAGWNTDDAYDVLCRGLVTAGFDISDVQGVLVTHIHPDHYGLAGRIREASGAWVALHPADAALVHDRYEEPTDLLERVGTMLRRFGAPAAEVMGLQQSAMPVRGFVDW